MRSKIGCVDRVHADRHAVEAGGLERRGESVEQMAVGGQREVERFAARWCAEPAKLADQIDQSAAQQRFAAGEPDLGDAQIDEQPDDAQVFIDRELGILGAQSRRCGNRRTCSCSGR